MPTLEWIHTYPGCPCRPCKGSARPHPKSQPVCECCREDGNDSSAQRAERDFLARIHELRKEYNIRPGEGTQRDRTRIALLVTDAFLTAWGEHGGDISQGLAKAPVLEWQIFEAGEGLLCNPLESELHTRDRERATGKNQGFNPLAMHPRPDEKLLAPCALVRKALNILKGGTRNAEPEGTHSSEGNPERRRSDGIPEAQPREGFRYTSILEE